MEDSNSCCNPSKKEGKGIFSGIISGLIPHIGCISFLIFAIFGVTAATAFFKPLMMSPFFFYILIGISFFFATISAFFYLRKNKALSLEGIKRKRNYLSILYGSTIIINIFLFFVIFPVTANMMDSPTGAIVGIPNEELTLKVAIPCPGHASLIVGELYTLEGVSEVKYRTGHYFDIKYDSSITSQGKILDLDVFNTYPATVI